ncbi:MAG: sugar-binding protein, partial [Kiritimatiellae bacterium]|nr:sugar-binding protein [Kiritimatiellia bacterium]
MFNARRASRDRQASLAPEPPLVSVSDEELAGAEKKVLGGRFAAAAKAEALALLAVARKQRSFGYNERAQRLMRLALETSKPADYFAFPEDVVTARRASVPVKIDGLADEWRDVPRTSVKPGAAAGGEFAIQWDQDNLYVLAVVRDPDLREVEEQGSDANWVWLFDGIRLALNPANTAPLALGGPLYDAVLPVGQTYLAVSITGRKYASSACGFSAAAVKSAVQKVEGGYVMELAIPMEDAMVPAIAGADVGLRFSVANHGSGMGFTRFCDRESMMSDSLHFGRLRLTE